jgi:hypothetical protein
MDSYLLACVSYNLLLTWCASNVLINTFVICDHSFKLRVCAPSSARLSCAHLLVIELELISRLIWVWVKISARCVNINVLISIKGKDDFWGECYKSCLLVYVMVPLKSLLWSVGVVTWGSIRLMLCRFESLYLRGRMENVTRWLVFFFWNDIW